MAVGSVYWSSVANRAYVDARKQLAELFVFLFLIMPSLLFSFVGEGTEDVEFTTAASAIILRNAALSCLVLFFLWRNGEPVSSIGISHRRIFKDIILGVLLYIPLIFAIAWLQSFFERMGFTFPPGAAPISSPTDAENGMLFAVVLVLAVAFTEEMIFRGYLMMRIMSLTGNARLAVVFSATVFAVGHGYQGSVGVLTVGFLGIVFSLVYLWRGTLTAAIVMHALQDILGLVVIPFYLSSA